MKFLLTALVLLSSNAQASQVLKASCSVTRFEAQPGSSVLFDDVVLLIDGKETSVFAADNIEYVATFASSSGVKGENYLSLKQIKKASNRTLSEAVAYPRSTTGFRLDNIRGEEKSGIEIYFMCSLN
jgi:hypothetical protein